MPRKTYYQEHKKECGEYAKEYHQKHKKKKNEYNKKYYAEKPQRSIYNYNLKRSFGITIDDYDRIFEKQGGVCAICGNRETIKNRWGTKRLSVDHDHETGEVRGLLCRKCNAGLGFFEDKIDNLNSAIDYLKDKYKRG